MHEFYHQGRRILLEGAQGLLLSIEHGIHPYVTSSDCSLNGTATGVGLSARAVDLPLGIVKFPFMTRVGGGPFPTELGGSQSEEYCAKESTKKDELAKNGINFEQVNNKIKYDARNPKIKEMINSGNPLTQSIGLRLAAGEYGATTGRPRRIGWTDAVAARYAVNINGPLMILTKTDCLSEADEFKICFGYNTEGKTIETFPRDEKMLRDIQPLYRTYKRYGDISQLEKYEDSPESLKQSINEFEKFTGGKVVILSVGSDREQTIGL